MKPGSFTHLHTHTLSEPEEAELLYTNSLKEKLLSAAVMTLDVCEPVPSCPWKSNLSPLVLWLYGR